MYAVYLFVFFTYELDVTPSLTNEFGLMEHNNEPCLSSLSFKPASQYYTNHILTGCSSYCS